VRRGRTLRALPLPRGANWYELPTLVIGGPDRMPQLEPDATPAADGIRPAGRPKLEDREPERVEAAAMLRDLHGWSLHQIAAATHPERGHEYGRRDAERGHARLRRLGVLPWAIFEGEPPANWLYSAEFAAAVREWRRETVIRLFGQAGSSNEWIRNQRKLRDALHNIEVTPWRPPSPKA
jgi:hypothetical protein